MTLRLPWQVEKRGLVLYTTVGSVADSIGASNVHDGPEGHRVSCILRRPGQNGLRSVQYIPNFYTAQTLRRSSTAQVMLPDVNVPAASSSPRCCVPCTPFWSGLTFNQRKLVVIPRPPHQDIVVLRRTPADLSTLQDTHHDREHLARVAKIGVQPLSSVRFSQGSKVSFRAGLTGYSVT